MKKFGLQGNSSAAPWARLQLLRALGDPGPLGLLVLLEPEGNTFSRLHGGCMAVLRTPSSLSSPGARASCRRPRACGRPAREDARTGAPGSRRQGPQQQPRPLCVRPSPNASTMASLSQGELPEKPGAGARPGPHQVEGGQRARREGLLAVLGPGAGQLAEVRLRGGPTTLSTLKIQRLI
jgi:hypothetical protein